MPCPRQRITSVFVVVVFVFGVPVAVVEVIHMVVVRDWFVGAVRSAVLVFGNGVFGLDFLGHDLPPSRAPAGRTGTPVLVGKRRQGDMPEGRTEGPEQYQPLRRGTLSHHLRVWAGQVCRAMVRN
jgi:hypothetical protein